MSGELFSEKKAVVICAGSVGSYAAAKAMINDGDFIVCADGGLRHAEAMGLKPNAVVGDFDSYGAVPEGENVVALNPEKDYSDTYMAAFEAVKQGFTELLLIGASGTRLDHVFANLSLLEALRQKGVRAALWDENNLIFAAEKHETIAGKKGMTVSLLPILPTEGVTLKGFKYPLDNVKLDITDPIWISNEMTGSTAEISFRSGALLIDIPRD